MIEVNGKILASAFTSYFGREVWVASAPADAPVLVTTICPAGPLTICGSNVVLKANTEAGYSYQWRKGTTNIAGANASAYNATASGLYSFLITDPLGNKAVSDVVIVTIASPPPATITAAGPITFCSGKNVLLRATSGAGYTYQWKKAGVNIDNATSYIFAANASALYSVVVTNAAGCSINSSGINVVVTSLPLATLTAAGPLTFCLGKSVLLKAATGAGYSYQWEKGNINISGAVSPSYTATASGAYNVTVTNTAGCSMTSAGKTVVANPLPLATITPTGSLTFCSGKSVLLTANTGAGYIYQWKKGNVNVAGATLSNYTATTSGIIQLL